MSSKTTTWILELTDRVSKPMRTIQGAGRAAEVRVSSVDRALTRLKKNAINAFGAFALWQGFTGLAKLGFDLEATKIKFEVLLGSGTKALNLLRDIDKFANATPFENADLKKNAELLLNYGISGNKILPILKMLGDVSGGNKDKLNALTLAYSQVMSTGKLMGQDLLQMINAGFNPLQIISERTGKSIGFLKDQMSKGRISALMVSEAFEIATGSGGRFEGMMEKISQTGQGKLSTLLGTLRTKLAVFSERYLVPVLVQILEVGIQLVNNVVAPIKQVINALSIMKDWIQENIVSLGFFTISLIALNAQAIIGHLNMAIFVLRFKAYVIWTKIATAAQWLLNTALTANPIGLVVAAISALIGITIMAYKRVGWFRGAIDAAWVSIKGFGKILKEFIIDRIKSMIAGITGIGKTLLLFFKGDWKAAWETGKQATKDLLGIDAAKKAAGKFKDVGKDAAEAYRKGVDSVKKSKLKAEAEKGGANNILGDNPTADQLAVTGATTPTGGSSDLGGSSGKGKSAAGKIITQNLNITNNFKVDKDSRASMDDLADQLAGRITDMLRDGLIALN